MATDKHESVATMGLAVSRDFAEEGYQRRLSALQALHTVLRSLVRRVFFWLARAHTLGKFLRVELDSSLP